MNNIRVIIRKELEKINFDYSYKGTKLFSEVIYECYIRQKKEESNFNLDRDIYPIVAQKCNIDKNEIKVYIFQSISKMYNVVNKNRLFDYLKYKIDYRPKTKELIVAVLKKIKNI